LSWRAGVAAGVAGELSGTVGLFLALAVAADAQYAGSLRLQTVSRVLGQLARLASTSKQSCEPFARTSVGKRMICVSPPRHNVICAPPNKLSIPMYLSTRM
jgi:hypothetical protein